METKLTYEKPLTEELKLSAPVVLQTGSPYYYDTYNEVFTVNYYGEWDGE